MSLPNPYTPGATPRILAGRRAERDRIRATIGRVAAFGEMAGPPLIFQGPRGLGKTSLLRAAQRDAEEHGFITAWVAGRRGQPLLAELAVAVTDAVTETDSISEHVRERARLKLTEISVELGAPSGIRTRGTAGVTSPVTSRGGAPTPALERLLHTASRKIRAGGGAGLIVFLDELHAPSRIDLGVVLNALQNLSGRREDNPLAVIGAGLPSTAGELTKAATFGERSTFVGLDRLSDIEAAEAVTAPARLLGAAWATTALDRVTDYAQGFPHLLQVAAHETWETAKPVDGAEIDPEAAAQGLKAAARLLHAMYEARWSAASDLEQRFLAAMARTHHDTVPRAVIARALDRTSRSLSVPRERLIDKGIIEPAPEHGRLRFTLPGFDEYIRTKDDDA